MKHVGWSSESPPRAGSERAAVLRRVGGTTELMLFAVGGGALYLATLLAVTLTWGKDLPLLGWIGFAIASLVVLAASTIPRPLPGAVEHGCGVGAAAAATG